MTQEQVDSAIKIAQSIIDSDSECDSYAEFIQNGGEPSNHVWYHAMIVLGYFINNE